MNKEALINQIKSTYSREVRKNLIKSIIESEKSDNTQIVDKQYKIINQIFSYVIKESSWKIASNSNNIDTTPLDIMVDSFPKIANTKWYQEKIISITKD